MCGCKAQHTSNRKRQQPLKKVRKPKSEPVMTVVEDDTIGLKIVVGEIIRQNNSDNVQLYQK